MHSILNTDARYIVFVDECNNVVNVFLFVREILLQLLVALLLVSTQEKTRRSRFANDRMVRQRSSETRSSSNQHVLKRFAVDRTLCRRVASMNYLFNAVGDDDVIVVVVALKMESRRSSGFALLLVIASHQGLRVGRQVNS